MEEAEIGKKLSFGLALRSKYTPTNQRPCIDLPKDLDFSWHEGVIKVVEKGKDVNLLPAPTLDEFYDDMEAFFAIRTEGSVVSFAYSRLTMMKSRFEIYTMLNHEAEMEAQRLTPHTDFYNIRKVDTHIHHSAAMNCKHLLRFMKRKLKNHGNDVVIKENGKDVTLKEVFNRLNIEPIDLSLDKLQMWTDRTCMHRFDRFNNLYSPMGQSLLRTVFLKTDNDMGGRYLAEITQELLDDMEETKYLHTEWRLSIYGRKRTEWDTLAKWVLGSSSKEPRKPLLSSKNRWMIQIPRLYSMYKKMGQLSNFQEMLENIFTPMVEATLGIGEHKDLQIFLSHVSGFDTVDDESKSKSPVDRLFSSRERRPDTWDLCDNPSYKYYSFFIQTNLRVVNRLRAARGLNQFQFRPHCGEAGEVHHLDSSFLLADNIQHGINLRKSPSLQYLYYLARVGLSCSPISNNQLFVPIEKNPFPQFFALGMLVTLSSDDPLMFHQTREALTEEYSVAKQLWRLGTVDLCEIAHNSVLISGFPKEVKEEWLGITGDTGSVDVRFSNVPQCRYHFRHEVFSTECATIFAPERIRKSIFLEEGGKGDGSRTPKSKTYNKMMTADLPVDQAGLESETASSASDPYQCGSPNRTSVSVNIPLASRDHSTGALSQGGKRTIVINSHSKEDLFSLQPNTPDDTALPGELRMSATGLETNGISLARRDSVTRRRSPHDYGVPPGIILPWMMVGFLLGYITAMKR